MPLFSVLIPAYKISYLEQAINSVLRQNYKDFELIIVDDASPENLTQVISKFNDCRIKYYRNDKNFGALNVVDNWNKCLFYATGDYVLCMGDDDILCENCLEEYKKLIDKYPSLNVFHGRTEIINENSKFVRLTEARPEYESVYSLIWHRWRNRSQYIGDLLFKKDSLVAKGGFYKLPLAWGSDDVTSYMMALDYGIANTQVPVFQYRQSNYTITNSGNVYSKLDAIQLEKKWIASFLENNNPTDELDIKYKNILLNDIPRVFNKKKIIVALSEHLQFNSFSRYCSLCIHSKRNKLSLSLITISYLLTLLTKIKRKHKNDLFNKSKLE